MIFSLSTKAGHLMDFFFFLQIYLCYSAQKKKKREKLCYFLKKFKYFNPCWVRTVQLSEAYKDELHRKFPK